MNSLEWRVKKLENKILGQSANAGAAQLDRILSQSADEDSILDQLLEVSKQYNNYLESVGGNYAKFAELYQKNKGLLKELDQNPATAPNSSHDTTETTAKLVLAHEEELTQYVDDLKTIDEKGKEVLSVDKWPDLGGFQERLDKLERITAGQHIQSDALDKRTEELIDIYNDIIGSFKSNMVIWNERLEAYENEEKKADEDE